MKGLLMVKIFTLFFLMLLVSRAEGTTTNIWTQSTKSEFDKGLNQNVSIHSTVCDKHGNLYAGTSPRGIIYKINNRGEASVFCSLPAAYVWDMAVDNDSNLFAATGNEGRLVKGSPDG